MNLPAPGSTAPPLRVRARVQVPVSEKPCLFVVVDTEEEFDWHAAYERGNTAVSAMRHIGRAQAIFDRFGIKPTYVIDYPVASQPDGYLPLREIWQDGRCDIGAHLHPWVNPPETETLSVANSFTSNLPAPLQRAKLEALVDAIGAQFEQPRAFKAGRYGLSAVTAGLIDELGFEVDNSVCPRHDFSDLGGPSYTGFDAEPFMATDRVLEIPCTVDYVGWAGPLRQPMHELASRESWSKLRAVGVLAKAGAVNKIMLSPEGNTFAEMRALTRALVARECRTFTLSFHSPSVEPGHTPYVRSETELRTFLADLERFCEFFFAEAGGQTSTLVAFRSQAEPWLRMTA